MFSLFLLHTHSALPPRLPGCSMSWLGGDDPGGGGFGYDYPWWAAEDRSGPRSNLTWEEKCRTLDYEYHVVTAVISGMFLVFGVVYSLFGEYSGEGPGREGSPTLMASVMSPRGVNVGGEES